MVSGSLQIDPGPCQRHHLSHNASFGHYLCQCLRRLLTEYHHSPEPHKAICTHTRTLRWYRNRIDSVFVCITMSGCELCHYICSSTIIDKGELVHASKDRAQLSHEDTAKYQRRRDKQGMSVICLTPCFEALCRCTVQHCCPCLFVINAMHHINHTFFQLCWGQEQAFGLA